MGEVSRINERLDKYASEMLACYEELLDERALLEKSLDDGYVNMSKARSIIGCASLSRLQIPLDEDGLGMARFKVRQFEDVDDDDGLIRFELDNSDQVTPLHPPKWIGPLPPLSLKMSQKAFARALTIAVTIADLQSRLRHINDAYKSLLRDKSRLEE